MNTQSFVEDPERLRNTALQFAKFGAVGVVGFLVDVAVLWVCVRLAGTNPYAGRGVSYLFAATTTWALNRSFTFRGAASEPLVRQWAKFLVTNAVGGLVNYGVYAALVTYVGLFAHYPEAAVAAGSLAGMLLNFSASKALVFKDV